MCDPSQFRRLIHSTTYRERECIRIARRNQKSGVIVGNDVEDPADCAGDDRFAVAHRFDQHHAKPFGVPCLSNDRRKHKGITPGEESLNRLRRYDSFEHHAITEPQEPCLCFEGHFFGTSTNYAEGESRVIAKLVHRIEQHGNSFAPHKSSNEQKLEWIAGVARAPRVDVAMLDGRGTKRNRHSLHIGRVFAQALSCVRRYHRHCVGRIDNFSNHGSEHAPGRAVPCELRGKERRHERGVRRFASCHTEQSVRYRPEGMHHVESSFTCNPCSSP